MLGFPRDSPFKLLYSLSKLSASILRGETLLAVTQLCISAVSYYAFLNISFVGAPVTQAAVTNTSASVIWEGARDSISDYDSHDDLALVTIKGIPAKTVVVVRNLDATSGKAVTPSNFSLDGCDLPLENLSRNTRLASVILVVLATDNRAVVLAVLAAMLSAAVADMNTDLVGKSFALLGGKNLRHDISLSFKCWLSCLLIED
jgi:hypothetical protein